MADGQANTNLSAALAAVGAAPASAAATPAAMNSFDAFISSPWPYAGVKSALVPGRAGCRVLVFGPALHDRQHFLADQLQGLLVGFVAHAVDAPDQVVDAHFVQPAAAFDQVVGRAGHDVGRVVDE